MKREPMWKKGDVVNIYQLSHSKGLIFEGRATVAKTLDAAMDHYMVRFHKKDGTVARETYERFIDREGQGDPSDYIEQFNKRLTTAA